MIAKIVHTFTNKQRILVCPLDWGLGHATRCIPLIYAFLKEGHTVLLAGSGPSLLRLKQEFPQLQAIDFPSFTLQYSKGTSQVWAVVKALPRLVKHTQWEHRALPSLLAHYNITMVVSDNRFGLFTHLVPCAYLTHQLWIKLPSPFTFLEPLVARWHRRIIAKYTYCWVPDYADIDASLAGELSHPKRVPANVMYVGPLSRFSLPHASHRSALPTSENTLTLALLSGVEPQRSIFEQYLLDSLQIEPANRVVLVQGLPQTTQPPYKNGKVEVFPYLSTEQLLPLLQQATRIICRSGYSTVMDLAALGKLQQAVFVPTPGQSEQEYLAQYLRTKHFG